MPSGHPGNYTSLTDVTRQDGLFGLKMFQDELTLADRTDDGAEISRRARNIGPTDAIWLVPPSLEQFRYVAGKAVVADFTSIPLFDAGLREWRQRMLNVYGETQGVGFEALGEMMTRYRDAPMFEAANRIYGADYAVIFADSPWDGDVLAEVGVFKIVRIAP